MKTTDPTLRVLYRLKARLGKGAAERDREAVRLFGEGKERIAQRARDEWIGLQRALVAIDAEIRKAKEGTP